MYSLGATSDGGGGVECCALLAHALQKMSIEKIMILFCVCVFTVETF